MSQLFWMAGCYYRDDYLAEAANSSIGGGSTPYDCSASAQTYQDRYRATSNVSDLVCMQKALERETRSR